MEEFEVDGIWWIPDYPDHRITGRLKFHPANGATLELFGDDFSGEIRELFGSPKKQPNTFDFYILPDVIVIDTLLGIGSDGTAITLVQCRHTGGIFVGFAKEIYQAGVVFSGCHFARDDELVFDKLLIEYTNLESWLGISRFAVSVVEEPRYEFTLSYITPEPLEIQIDNNLKIVFRYSFGWKEQYTVTDFYAKQTPIIEIIPSEPMHYDDYHHRVIYHLRNFLSLGMATTVLPTSVKGISDGCQTETPKDEDHSEISIFYAAKGSDVDEARRQTSVHTLFNYRQIAEGFPEYLRNWFAKAEKLRPVMDQYFGLFYIPAMYLHLEFLTLAQALETYHHRIYGGKHTLRERLELIMSDVLAPYRQDVQTLIKDQSSFVDKLKNTRDYLTHYNEKLEKKAITDPNEQFAFVQRMKLIMQLCFFVEMEIPAETVHQIVQHDSKFQYWSHRE